MSKGGHFNYNMVNSFNFEEFKNLNDREKEEIVNEMNIIHMNNDKEDIVMSDKKIFELAYDIVHNGNTRVYPTKQNPQVGGKREMNDFMKAQVAFLRKLVKELNVKWYPSVMANIVKECRKKSSSKDSVEQIKDGEKWAFEHLDEVRKLYEKYEKEMNDKKAKKSSGGKSKKSSTKKPSTKKSTTKKTGKK